MQDLQVEGSYEEEWSRYMEALNHAGITLSSSPDMLVWGRIKVYGLVTTKFSYDLIFESDSRVSSS